MANYSKILQRNEKKLVIGHFLPDEVKEVDENGEVLNNDFITIKKLPHSIKTKMQILATGTVDGDKQKRMYKALKEKGLSFNDLDSLTDDEKVELFINMDVPQKDVNGLTDMTLQMQRLILEFGVDSKKHSFVDYEELDYDFWESMPEAMTLFVIKEIENFSKGFSLGE